MMMMMMMMMMMIFPIDPLTFLILRYRVRGGIYHMYYFIC